MLISAIVTASQHLFVATLSDGRQMEARTVTELAKVLHFGGVQTQAVRCEWHSGQRMLTAGQQVALSAAIRSLECGEPTPPIGAHAKERNTLRPARVSVGSQLAY